MKSAPFKYMRPDTLEEALSVLVEHGEDVRVLAGGQSLGAMLNMRIVTPSILLDLNLLTELSWIEEVRGFLATAALVRQRDALDDATVREHIPLLAQALPHVGHYQTRNRGTLGGSVAHADPSAEIPLVLATLGGEVELRTARQIRRVKASQFFRSALVTAREPEELLTALYWPRRNPAQRSAFVEFAVREGDFAIVAVACTLDAGTLRIGFAGCGETPQIIERTGLVDLDAATIQTIAREASAGLACQSDLLGSSEYRRQLAAVLASKAMSALTRETVHA
ncbi:MAG: FAD binding domain-containing protein [Pseudolabrys sp.]